MNIEVIEKAKAANGWRFTCQFVDDLDEAERWLESSKRSVPVLFLDVTIDGEITLIGASASGLRGVVLYSRADAAAALDANRLLHEHRFAGSADAVDALMYFSKR